MSIPLYTEEELNKRIRECNKYCKDSKKFASTEQGQKGLRNEYVGEDILRSHPFNKEKFEVTRTVQEQIVLESNYAVQFKFDESLWVNNNFFLRTASRKSKDLPFYPSGLFDKSKDLIWFINNLSKGYTLIKSELINIHKNYAIISDINKYYCDFILDINNPYKAQARETNNGLGYGILLPINIAEDLGLIRKTIIIPQEFFKRYGLIK